ncbi:karyopherin alpha subunit [Aspergillus luchuensis]|uniref:Karyopherin alpha subunit n=1 Tax=Aspergillus kawachii TaxID=1069201 RepID=A0A146FS52_ASPKA|nr:karyopherin alpha subunit [Aspergillus luchuensis]
MFAPGQEQLSKEEIRAGEIQANQTIRMAVSGGILLYLCEFFACPGILFYELTIDSAPFAIDFVKKFL